MVSRVTVMVFESNVYNVREQRNEEDGDCPLSIRYHMVQSDERPKSVRTKVQFS
jgi:hypothetical protein